MHKIKNSGYQRSDYANQRAYHPAEVVHIECGESFTRECDVELSFGRKTNMGEIVKLLIRSGAFPNLKAIQDNIMQINVGKHLISRRVIITSKHKKDAFNIDYKLNQLRNSGIKYCHSFQIPITLSNNRHTTASLHVDVIDDQIKKMSGGFDIINYTRKNSVLVHGLVLPVEIQNIQGYKFLDYIRGQMNKLYTSKESQSEEKNEISELEEFIIPPKSTKDDIGILMVID